MLSMYYGRRLEELETRIFNLQSEVKRLMRVRDYKSGSHEWDLKYQKCFVCGMSLQAFEMQFEICAGHANLREPLDYQI